MNAIITRPRRHVFFTVSLILVSVTFLFCSPQPEPPQRRLVGGLAAFDVADPPPACGATEARKPVRRDPKAYRLYTQARRLWRSKPEWQLSRTETMRILSDVRQAADRGDWEAQALLAQFYLYGLGVVEANHVLAPAPGKAIDMAWRAALLHQPWGLYHLALAHMYGHGGMPVNSELAWAYHLQAATRGSPEAQLALADAYGDARQPAKEEAMRQCAYRRGSGAAALALGVHRKAVLRDMAGAVRYFQDGVVHGSGEAASRMGRLFGEGTWPETDAEGKAQLQALSIASDPERSRRYEAIADALRRNPDLRFPRLDEVLPLPPGRLPPWRGIDDALPAEPDGGPLTRS